MIPKDKKNIYTIVKGKKSLKHNSYNVLEANMFPVINVKSFIPAIEAVILRSNMIEQDVAFKVVEKLHQLHQNQWQFNCHQFGVKYMYYMTF